mmetsp:Transcript_39606/g.93148  ORF Transcript_39606/g.93148 Transcript_39606/m.93148 type:complete len:153 (+) Transcript_39606:244-702(+)
MLTKPLRRRSFCDGPLPGAFLPNTNRLCEKRAASLEGDLQAVAAPEHLTAEETTDGVNDCTAASFGEHALQATAEGGGAKDDEEGEKAEEAETGAAEPRLSNRLQDMYGPKYAPRRASETSETSETDFVRTQSMPSRQRGFDKPLPQMFANP